jgi:RecB family endonuclease NucS
MKYTILLGDWSGDGHNFTKTFYLDITENFTEEELKVNYNNNVDKIGFGYGAIACEYEDSIISCEQIKALEKAGMNFVYLSCNE